MKEIKLEWLDEIEKNKLLRDYFIELVKEEIKYKKIKLKNPAMKIHKIDIKDDSKNKLECYDISVTLRFAESRNKK